MLYNKLLLKRLLFSITKKSQKTGAAFFWEGGVCLTTKTKKEIKIIYGDNAPCAKVRPKNYVLQINFPTKNAFWRILRTKNYPPPLRWGILFAVYKS